MTWRTGSDSIDSTLGLAFSALRRGRQPHRHRVDLAEVEHDASASLGDGVLCGLAGTGLVDDDQALLLGGGLSGERRDQGRCGDRGDQRAEGRDWLLSNHMKFSGEICGCES